MSLRRRKQITATFPLRWHLHLCARLHRTCACTWPASPGTNLKRQLCGNATCICLRRLIVALTFLILAAIPLGIQAEVSPKITLQHPSNTSFCYITPPKGWEIANPASLSKSVQIAFFKKTSNHFRPSINLSIEKTDLSLDEYLKVIRNLHESNRYNRWRKLGKVHTESGIGQLTEIDTTTEQGAVRMLQLILMQQGHAYVVTAAAPKDEMPLYHKEFQTAFRTLHITSDLISTIPQLEQRESLKLQSERLLDAWKKHLVSSSEKAPSLDDPVFQKNHWIPFQNYVIQDFEEMGAHWQILVLKTTQEKMLLSTCN